MKSCLTRSYPAILLGSVLASTATADIFVWDGSCGLQQNEWNRCCIVSAACPSGQIARANNWNMPAACSSGGLCAKFPTGTDDVFMESDVRLSTMEFVNTVLNQGVLSILGSGRLTVKTFLNQKVVQVDDTIINDPAIDPGSFQNLAGAMVSKVTGPVSTGVADFSLPFENHASGLVRVNQGTVRFLKGGSSAGEYWIAADSAVVIDSLVTLLAEAVQSGDGFVMITGSGDLRTDLSANPIFTNVDLFGMGRLSGEGTLTITGQFNCAGILVDAGRTLATIGSTTNMYQTTIGGHVFENRGTVACSSASVQLDNGGRFENTVWGVTKVSGQVTFGGSHSGTMENTGLLQKQSGELLRFNNGAAFVQNGKLDVEAGEVRILGGGSCSGLMHIHPGAQVTIGSTYAFKDKCSVQGDGRLIVGLPALSGGLIITETVLVENLDLSARGAVGGTGILDISGQMTWDGGSLNDSGELRVLPNAVLDIQGSNQLLMSDRQVSNFGIINWSNNDIDAENGAQIINAPHAYLIASGPRRLRHLAGQPHILVNAGELKFDALRVDGAFEQTHTGNMHIDIGGVTPGLTFDQLNTGAAALDGTLALSLKGGFAPSVGSQFEVIKATSIVGTFDDVDVNNWIPGLVPQILYSSTNVIVQIGICSLGTLSNWTEAHYDIFADCFSGPKSLADPTNCHCFDTDGDTDLDLDDFGVFQNLFGH